MQGCWDPRNAVFIMGSIVRPGHESLTWLSATDKEINISQLRKEMLHGTCTVSDVLVDTFSTKKAKSSVFKKSKLLINFALVTQTPISKDEQIKLNSTLYIIELRLVCTHNYISRYEWSPKL